MTTKQEVKHNIMRKIMELVLDVGNRIYETHKRETSSFTQQLYEEQKWRNKILKERNKEWDALLKECEK